MQHELFRRSLVLVLSILIVFLCFMVRNYVNLTTKVSHGRDRPGSNYCADAK
jgi:hypothetical protein